MPPMLKRSLTVAISAGVLAACAGAPPSTTQATLDADFDGANLAHWTEVAPDTFEVSIRGDTNADHYRWYAFDVIGAAGEDLTVRVANAGGANASGAWEYNRPVVSADGGATWRRIADTEYDGEVFTFTFSPRADTVRVAYNPVYTFARWRTLVDSVRTDPAVREASVIAESLDGHPVHMLEIADPDGAADRPVVWAVARQHPSETGGSWMAEGFLRWLLGDSDQAAALRRRAVVRLVGFMNPDGVLRGNYRVNRAGRNLNREWDDPDPATAPSVAAVRRAMREDVEAGREVAVFVDFHAHSTLRKNFFFYNDDRATTPEMHDDMRRFIGVLNEINPDFTAEGSSAGSGADTRIAKNWAARALGIHAVTFESSYQDVTYGPYAGEYVTTDRLRALGADFGRAVAEHFYGIERSPQS